MKSLSHKSFKEGPKPSFCYLIQLLKKIEFKTKDEKYHNCSYFDHDTNKTKPLKLIFETLIFQAQFMEKMELNNFPVDLQELNVLVATKLDTKSINLITENFSLINREAKRTFVDQQKWFIF